MTEQTNRLAVNAMEAAALANQWFFREQAISDQGIDAHVEKYELVPGKKGSDEVGTGRLIGIQIKGGPSYFSKPSPNGWWFPFNERKKQLWLGHALPVLVVLVDLDAGVQYWQRISPATVIKTGKDYKIEVPSSQIVANSDAEWTEIAGGLEAHALARFDFSLLGVPPSVRGILENCEASEHGDAALLANHMAEGRTNPGGTVRALIQAKPAWIVRNGRWAWHALAGYASDHDLHELAAEAYLLAADDAPDDAKRSQRLTSAALLLREVNEARSLELLAEARALAAPDPVFLAIASTIFSRQVGDARPFDLDPLFVSLGSMIDESVPAQRLLAMQARRQDDLDKAVEHGRRALALDEANSESMSQLAVLLLARWNLAGAVTADLVDSIRFLEAVIEQNREWSGPTDNERHKLVGAYAMSGRFESILKLTLPPPFGAAEPYEVDQDLVRSAAFAARSLGRADALSAACDLFGNDTRDTLMKVSVGVIDLPPSEVTALRERALDEAIADERFEDIAGQAVTLSSEGVDASAKIKPFVERGILPVEVPNLLRALVRAHADLDEALPTLRELAKTDPAAAEHLIGRLRSSDRNAEAAEVAKMLFDVTGSEMYLLDRADALIDAGVGDDAVEAAKEALALSSIRPIERGRLLTFLGGTAAEEQDWAKAEGYLNQVLELFDRPDDSSVWRVVVCLVNQGRIKKAAKLIASRRPEVRNKEEAELWLQAHATLRWTESIAMDAYALAERFEDPSLSTALLGQIVMNTRGVPGSDERGDEVAPDGELEELDEKELEVRRTLAQESVPGDLHRRAFELMEKLVSTHGEATGITVMKADSPDAMVEQMVETLKESSAVDQALADLVPMVRDSRLPLGFLAGAFHKGYATLVLQRALGVLVSSSPDDAEHETEVAAARAAFGLQVAVDAATVVTLTGLTDPTSLTGRFPSLAIPPAAIHGLHRASFDVRGLAGSPGTMRWDDKRGGIVLTELDTAQYTRLYIRSEKVQDYAERLQVRTVTERTLELGFDDDRHQTEWADVLHLSAEHKLPIWSDDLGLRRLARSLGLTAFGTPAVAEAIRDERLEASGSAAEDKAAIEATHWLHLELAADLVVDLPLDGGAVVKLAERDDWMPHTAAAVISRPIWWANNPNGFETVKQIYAGVAAHAPDSLPAWQHAAMYGSARALNADSAPGLLAIFALSGFDDAEASDEVRLAGLKRAMEIAAELGLPDPTGGLPAAADLLRRSGRCADPEGLVKRLSDRLDDSSQATGQ